MQILNPLKTHRQQSLNVLLQEGGDVIPVQDVSQPAVLPRSHHLVTSAASSVGGVLENARNVLYLSNPPPPPTDIRKLNGLACAPPSSPYLDKPGVVQSVPKLQNLFLNHSRVVHLVS